MGRSTPAGHRTASRYAPTHPSPSPTRRRADAPRRAQQTYATYLQRWTAWCTGCGLARRALRRGGQHLPIGAGGNLIDVNPCARIPRPTVLRELQRREVLTVLEYAAFLTAARLLGPTHHVIAVIGGMLGLRASEMAGLTVDSLATVRGYATLTFIGKGDKPPGCRCPCPRCPRCGRPSMTAPAGRCCAPVAAPAWTAARCTATWPAPPRPLASPGPSGHTRCAAPSARSDNQGIPLRDIQRLLRHARPETTLASYDISGDALERHASHQVAGFCAGWGGLTRRRDAFPAPPLPRCPQGGLWDTGRRLIDTRSAW